MRNKIQSSFHFKSTVAQGTQIGLEGIKTGISGQIDIRKKIGGGTVIVIQDQIETVVHESQIQTDLKRLTLLPTQLRIHDRCIQDTCHPIIRMGIRSLSVQTIDIIVINTVHITVDTIRNTRFQCRYDIGYLAVLEKILFMDIPSGRYSRKESPAVIRQFRNSIITCYCRKQIAAFVIVCHTTEERGNPVSFTIRICCHVVRT